MSPILIGPEKTTFIGFQLYIFLSNYLFLTKILSFHLGSVVEFDREPIVSAVEKVYKLVNNTDETNQLSKHVRHAVKTLETALDRYA